MALPQVVLRRMSKFLPFKNEYLSGPNKIFFFGYDRDFRFIPTKSRSSVILSVVVNERLKR